MCKPQTKPALSADELFDKMRQGQDVNDRNNGHNQKKARLPNPILERHTPHQWLDNYIEHSKKLSPLAFDLMHEVCGVWALSATVAGRATMSFGGKDTHFAIMTGIIAPSSEWAKSHTVGVATDLLEEAELDWRELPVSATPQYITMAMSDNAKVAALGGKLNKPDLSEEDEARLFSEIEELRAELGPLFANEGQRYWHISEFGSKVVEAMAEKGPMAKYSSFFRDINEKKKKYNDGTVTHGLVGVSHPFLAVIGDTTPSDLARYSAPNSKLWTNGFFARFLIITMTDQDLKNRREQEAAGISLGRVPADYVREANPETLIAPLQDLDTRLGRRTGYEQPLLKCKLIRTTKVYDSFYDYKDYIMTHKLPTEDLKGPYVRLAVRHCVAVAGLLALIDGSSEVMGGHVYRAQEFCERVRLSLETFYHRAVDNLSDERSTRRNLLEEKITGIIRRFHQRKGEWPVQSEIRRRTGRSSETRLPNEDITHVLNVLQMAGVVKKIKVEGKRNRVKSCWMLL